MSLNSLTSVKMAKSSLARGHMGGVGGDWRYLGTWDSRHGLGGPYTRKTFFRTQVPIHTQRTHLKTFTWFSPGLHATDADCEHRHTAVASVRVQIHVEEHTGPGHSAGAAAGAHMALQTNTAHNETGSPEMCGARCEGACVAGAFPLSSPPPPESALEHVEHRHQLCP